MIEAKLERLIYNVKRTQIIASDNKKGKALIHGNALGSGQSLEKS